MNNDQAIAVLEYMQKQSLELEQVEVFANHRQAKDIFKQIFVLVTSALEIGNSEIKRDVQRVSIDEFISMFESAQTSQERSSLIETPLARIDPNNEEEYLKICKWVEDTQLIGSYEKSTLIKNLQSPTEDKKIYLQHEQYYSGKSGYKWYLTCDNQIVTGRFLNWHGVSTRTLNSKLEAVVDVFFGKYRNRNNVVVPHMLYFKSAEEAILAKNWLESYQLAIKLAGKA